jgi:hypothetical protein
VDEVDALARPQRHEAERGEAADHGHRKEHRKHALVALEQPEDRVPWLALRHHGRHAGRL